MVDMTEPDHQEDQADRAWIPQLRQLPASPAVASGVDWHTQQPTRM